MQEEKARSILAFGALHQSNWSIGWPQHREPSL